MDSINILGKSSVRNMPVSPRRVQLVANVIRGRNVAESLNYLKFDQRKASKYIFEVLQTATANASAKNNIVAEEMVIENVMVGSGWTLKNRGIPGARGRFKPMKRKTTNLTITIAQKDSSSDSSKKDTNNE